MLMDTILGYADIPLFINPFIITNEAMSLNKIVSGSIITVFLILPSSGRELREPHISSSGYLMVSFKEAVN